MASPSPPVIRFDQLKSRYSIDVADDSRTPSLIANLGRSNLAADAALVLVVKLDQPADSLFHVFLGADRRDRCSLRHGETVSLFIALRHDGQMPTTGNASIRFRLQAAAKGGHTSEIPCTIEARLVTQALDPPDIKLFLEPDITFGVSHGSAPAPAEVIIATLTPSLASRIATYCGPPADIVLQTAAALVAPGVPPEPLPVRVGTRPIGRESPDEVSWSQGNQAHNATDNQVMLLRRAIPFPFDEGPVEMVLGVTVRDAIDIARRVADEGELGAEIDLTILLTLVTEGEAATLLQQRPRLAVRLNVASLITVASRDLDPVVLPLSHSRDVAPVQAVNPIRRRVNARSDSVNRASSLESVYPLTIEAFADTRDPRLDVQFAFSYEDQKIPFPDFAITNYELRHGKPIEMPLRAIIEASILKPRQKYSHVPQRGDLIVSFSFLEFESSPDPLFAHLSIPIEIEMIPPDVVACIDLGTSATSIWFGTVEGPNAGTVLPLGDAVHALSGDEHEEFEPNLGVKNVLLPSIIGLSSDLNMRSKLDPLSLGDIGLSVGGIVGAERRLKALERHYDVSVPFVPRQDIPAHRDSIVFHPKRSLITTRGRPPEVHAYEVNDSGVKLTGEVDIRKLIVDIFDELGAYLVPRAIAHFERLTPHWPERRNGALTDIWLEAKQPIGTIVTHPSGVSAQGREAYVEAGRQFLARFTGQPAEPGTSRHCSHLWVKLVPEAIAAINYGIGYLRDKGALGPGKHVLAALDIGAGTYDATLVEAEIGRGGLENWTVLSHFGLTVGGLDLDRAIADKVVSVLHSAFREPRVASILSLDPDQPAGAPASVPATLRFAREIAFQDEVQRAKKQLTARLFDLPESAAYAWSTGTDILFEVVVGRAPDTETLPVRLRQPSRVVGVQRIPVDTIGPTWLAIRPNKNDGAAEIVLQIGPGHFATNEDTIDPMSPATVVRFLGTVLPRMVMRELGRLKKKAPTWIVTGRTALWPPLYQAIGAVAASMPGSSIASLRPFPPSEMKVAVINGALALASNPHLPLGNDVLNPLAVLSIGADAQTTDSRRTVSGRRVTRIATIEYLAGSDRPNGEAKVRCSGRCELVRAVPGLSEPDAHGRPDRHALEMFDAFGIPAYECLISDIGQTVSTEGRDLCVEWKAGNRFTGVTIDAGDGRGPLRFEVPNREIRIYHD